MVQRFADSLQLSCKIELAQLMICTKYGSTVAVLRNQRNHTAIAQERKIHVCVGST